MKKLLFSLLLLSGMANAQIVNIPDPGFKSYLLSHNPTIDLNGSGEIEEDEAAQFTGPLLFVGAPPISDLTGIKAFTDLGIIACEGLTLTSLDVSGMTSLIKLDCFQSNLTSLNVSGCTSLQELWAFSNQITSLDVTGLWSLKDLEVQDNLLTSLIINGCPNMQKIYCYNNQIPALNVTGMTGLYLLSAGDNQITSLDMTAKPNLQYFTCQNNLLTTLDVSECTALGTCVFFGNNLTSLYLKNGQAEDIGLTIGNPNLAFICADDAQIATIQDVLASNSMTTTVVSSYCSFTPGGNFNTVTGNVLYDSDNNGCNAGDIVPTNVRIRLTDGNIDNASFVNSLNGYTLYAQAGNYTVSAELENPGYFTISPASAPINFPLLDNSTQNQDFCMVANGSHPDLEIVIAPVEAPRPGSTVSYKIVCKNKGTDALSGTIVFNYDGTLMTFLDSTVLPTTAASGTLAYNFTNMLPFAVSEIYITLSIHMPTDTPPVNIGDQLTCSASVSGTFTDEIPEDNAFSLTQTVVGSFDPNDITCLEGDVVAPSEIGKYLHYMINFENTGTADAQNIVVRDVIDETKFDINSLQLIETSHPARVNISGNVAEFIFEDINLEPSDAGRSVIGGHGNVLFKIKTKADLTSGTMVANKANIYFDYNFPVETNPAETTFAVLSNTVFAKDNSVSVYPNPAKQLVNIKADTNIKTIEIFDIQGRILETVLENGTTATLNIATKSSGIYFLKITTTTGSKVEKLVKD
ncbi:MAG TPA: T9SS type A sorting domain-containing protein [Flavobacterium sp.]|nr:T9SS type A sorting domain-containing protein [Flavobacterium sp.]